MSSVKCRHNYDVVIRGIEAWSPSCTKCGEKLSREKWMKMVMP